MALARLMFRYVLAAALIALLAAACATSAHAADPAWRPTKPVELVAINAPGGGYLVPAAHAAWVAERLKVHGIFTDAYVFSLVPPQYRALSATVTRRGSP